MDIVFRSLGALALSYLVSRIAIRIFASQEQPTTSSLAIAHGVSLAILMGLAGLVRAYWVPFDVFAGLIYVVPQLICFLLDQAAVRVRQ